MFFFSAMRLIILFASVILVASATDDTSRQVKTHFGKLLKRLTVKIGDLVDFTTSRIFTRVSSYF